MAGSPGRKPTSSTRSTTRFSDTGRQVSGLPGQMTTKPADSDPRFHGRRRGRKLRPGRERLLETFLPEVSLAMPVGEGAVDPHRLLPGAPAETWLEIGFGAGEHLA